MGNMVMMLVVVLLGVYVVMLWYWVRTIIIMGRQSFLLGILGFLFSPITQIIYHLSKKDQLSLEDRKDFNRYWLLFATVIVITIVSSVAFSTFSDTYLR